VDQWRQGATGWQLLIENDFHLQGAGGRDSPTFFTESYPQPLSTASRCPVDSPQRGRARPHMVNFTRRDTITPAQNIFAKVKAVIWPLTCGYSNSDEGHSTKVGNQSEILPYI